MRLTSTPYAGPDGRVPLNDAQRVSNKVDPPEDSETPPVGCLGFIIPCALFFWAVVGWAVYSNLR